MSDALIQAYDAAAARYAQQADENFKRRAYDRARYDVVLGLAPQEGPILDLGCGPGHVVDHLQRAGRKALGIDVSEGMLKEARARFSAEFQRADLLALPFGEAELSGMIAGWSLIHLPREALAARLQVLARHLRPFAPLLLVLHQGEGEAQLPLVPSDPANSLPVTCYQREELSGLVQRTGALKVQRIEGRRPYRFEAPLHHIFLTALRC